MIAKFAKMLDPKPVKDLVENRVWDFARDSLDLQVDMLIVRKISNEMSRTVENQVYSRVCRHILLEVGKSLRYAR